MPNAKPITLTPELITSFWERVQKSEGCWLWTGAKGGSDGYGKHGGSAAHRFSFAVHFYDPPLDMKVCHTCDNPQCVRPDHLFLGSDQENMRDMAIKGRHRSNSRQWLSLEKEIKAIELMRAGKSLIEIAKEERLPLQWLKNIRSSAGFRVAGPYVPAK